MVKPPLPEWAVWGDKQHRRNLINSIELDEHDLEERNRQLNAKYARIAENEQRVDLYHADDAEVLVVAFGTPARMAKGAVRALRDKSVAAGLFRPITLWPFPIDRLSSLLPTLKRIVVVEASNGQLEDEMRLALSYTGRPHPKIEHLRHFGGVLPQQSEIVDLVLRRSEVAA
jgi:pyruvate/2-oxoacid:ferredoxin oxidoreductase alpha subunit